MFCEFFCHKNARTMAFAWLGLVVFIVHSLFKAYLKRALNEWYRRFYDHLGAHVERHADVESSSGGEFDYVRDELADARDTVSADLVDFVILVIPAVFVHPVASFIRNHWVFAWRLALVRSYLDRWESAEVTIEGAAQRVHEDTQRLSRGIHGVVVTIIDSALTLAIFVPLLHERSPLLMQVAMTAAFAGIGVSIFVGRRLVGLEVKNQVVEGQLRTQLVQLELDTEAIRQNGSIGAAFIMVLHRLWENYSQLYKNFAFFNLWLSFFDQAMVVLPYIIAAPLLFAIDLEQAITLGELTSSMNAFDKVFGSISVISDQFTDITDFWSVVRRLREFERNLHERKSPPVKLPAMELVEPVPESADAWADE